MTDVLKGRSERGAALDTLADRRVFQLDNKRWKAFMAALAAPPMNNPKLRKLLARKPAWGKMTRRATRLSDRTDDSDGRN